jgi:hypothetical protein
VDRLCKSLSRILESEPMAFSDLRGSKAGSRRWQGLVVPPEMTSCAVEGDYYPGAEYVCRGSEARRGSAAMVVPRFTQMAADLDACLARPGWGDRGWQRGREFTFAYGERQITWRFGGNFHRPGLSLKVEEDLGEGGWYVRLAVLTLR